MRYRLRYSYHRIVGYFRSVFILDLKIFALVWRNALLRVF
jgi:hypothetical protein